MHPSRGEGRNMTTDTTLRRARARQQRTREAWVMSDPCQCGRIVGASRVRRRCEVKTYTQTVRVGENCDAADETFATRKAAARWIDDQARWDEAARRLA